MPRQTARPAAPTPRSPARERTPAGPVAPAGASAPASETAPADAGRRLEELVAREGRRVHRAGRRPR